MGFRPEQPQKARQLAFRWDGSGESAEVCRNEESARATHREGVTGSAALMEEVARPLNLRAAMRRVKKNRGAAGVDGMRVDELAEKWPELEGQLSATLLAGQYRPQPVRKHCIPKSNGGIRVLGIPTVMDRVVQQAILQVLQPPIDPTFSDSSFGFRPKRSAHQALSQGLKLVESGRIWVIDLDLKQFFDRVNHDVLMGRLAKRIEDKRLLRLLRRFLQAGMMDGGLFSSRREGTPQGGPLSPFLANLLLDEVDKALEARGHRFVRYADDLNVYLRSQRAAERVLDGLRKQLKKLRLEANEEKTKICPATKSELLGFHLANRPGGGKRWIIAKFSIQRFKSEVRVLTRRTQGRKGRDVIRKLSTFLRGWHGYYRYADVTSIFKKLDGWIRRRLRAYALKQWRTFGRIRGKCLALGAKEKDAHTVACSAGRWWRASQGKIRYVLTPKRFEKWGLYALAA